MTKKMSKYSAIRPPLYDLSDSPEHTKALGLLAASWALVEHQLQALFSFILRAPPWRTQPAYYAVINARARVDMIQASAKEMLGRDEFGEELDAKLDATKKVARKRNKYVHALWLTEDGKVYISEGSSTNFPFGKKRRCHPKEIKDAATEIQQVADDLGDFVRRYSKVHPLEVTESPDAWPTEVRRKRE